MGREMGAKGAKMYKCKRDKPAKHAKWSILCSSRSYFMSDAYTKPLADVWMMFLTRASIASSYMRRAIASVRPDCSHTFSRYS